MGERIRKSVHPWLNYLLPHLWYKNAMMLRLYGYVYLNYFALN